MIIGQYKILEKISDGGTGIDYKGENVTLEQIIALKVLPITFSGIKDLPGCVDIML